MTKFKSPLIVAINYLEALFLINHLIKVQGFLRLKFPLKLSNHTLYKFYRCFKFRKLVQFGY
jgi:hypothetical protein